MSKPITFAEYLLAKRSVDDAALHEGVYCRMVSTLLANPAPPTPTRVLEVGCGIGTMVERLAARGFFGCFPAGVNYTAIDSEPETIETARLRLEEVRPRIHLEAADLYEFAARPDLTPYHLVIANAVLDLLDLDRALPALRGLLAPGGLAWLTINFDGVTRFLPTVDPALDEAIERAYHATMDRRMTDGRPSGDSRTGSRLFASLPRHGMPILAAGPSDWIVHPRPGGYAEREADFLHFIVDTVAGALQGDPALDQAAFKAWVAARHGQIDSARLTYIAHQFDFLVIRMD